MISAPDICFFTEYRTKNILNGNDSIDYSIFFNQKDVVFSLQSDYDWKNSSLVKENLTIIRGEIYNKKWPTKGLLITIEEIEKLIRTSDVPKNPKEKLDRLFLELFKMQKFEGEIFSINATFSDPMFYTKLYFKNHSEYAFYLRILHDQGIINSNGKTVAITFKGLNYQIDLTENGVNSNNCFIAMSFGAGMNKIRDSIKKVVNETGFNALIIDELHIDPHKTINDEIIANIKKSKFCISDFTEQKDGVYFEAGFALGLGLKVIYTCHEKWFKKSHFDTNHFPHIIYKDNQELESKLKMKIEAWIK